MSKVLNLILLFSFMLTTVACGDMFMQKEDNDKEYNQFATCEFDVTALSQILTKNIKGDLLCLENNLNLFIVLVKGEGSKPGFLYYNALEDYLVNKVDDIDEETLKIVQAIFELNSLIFGGDVKYIAKENVADLTEILVNFNRVFVEGDVYEYYTTDEKIDFDEHNRRKSIIYSSLIKIGRVVGDAMVKNDNKIIIADFIEKFKNKKNMEALSYVESLLFVKKAILGGDEKTITSTEMKRLANILGDVGKVTYDFVNLPDTHTAMDQGEELLKILKEDLQTAYNNFYYKNSNDEIIVTYDKIVKLIKTFFPQYMKYVKYKTTFLKIKEILLESASEEITAVEISFLLNDLLYKNISKGVFVHRTYNENKSVLGTVRRIFYNLYNVVTFNSEEESYIVDLNRVVKDYRFYQGSNFAPIYGHQYIRNPRGLFDILLYEDLAQRFFAYYGRLDHTAKGDYVMSKLNFETFMKDFGELLEGEGYLLPGRAKNTAETIALMTGLFHGQSNGDDRIEIPEFVEFIVTLTTSMNLADDSKVFMEDRCETDEQGRIQASCFRQNFMDFMSSENKENKSINSYLPGLQDYLAGVKSQTFVEEYLVAASKFSRVCTQFKNGEEVPMRYGDFFVTWGGLLAVEQSMLRFDTNKSGVLEPREVNKAYLVYKSAIEAMIPVEFLKRYSKDFFQYLVKYKRIPEVPRVRGLRSLWRAIREGYHFAKFIFKSRVNKEANADRMTFAAVLKIIAENSPANKSNPYPCETLR